MSTRPSGEGDFGENRGAFEQRRYNSVALNSRGTAASVYARIMQLKDVIGCVVRENKTNVPKVIDGITLPQSAQRVCFASWAAPMVRLLLPCTAPSLPDATQTALRLILVEDDSTGIKEPIHFQRPTEVDVTIRLTFPNAADLSADSKLAIQEAVYANFYGEDPTVVDGNIMPRPLMGDTIYAPRFAISVQNAGYTDLLDVDVARVGGALGGFSAGSHR